MSYGQPPYGAPSGYNQYPPQGQYPPQQGGYPPQQPQYGAPPQQGYGGPPPGQYPPQGGYPPQGQYPPQQGYGAPPPQQYGAPQYGAPPQQGGYGPPQQQYGGPPPGPQTMCAPMPQFHGPPTPPSLGYGPLQQIPYNPDPDADALRKAMKGFGTDEKVLIQVLSTKDPLQVNLIRQSFNYRHSRNLEADIKSETSGYFEAGLVALTRGPLLQDVHLLRDAMQGMGTKEMDLNDVLLARSNADIAAIKSTYHQVFKRSLEADLKGDLSMKTERHFLMVIAGNRAEDSAPVIPQDIDRDVMDIYRATEGKVGTDELLVCSVLTQRNDAQIRAISQVYESKFRRTLENVIIKEFSGHMEKALLHQLRGGTDRALRDATLLEDAMAGAGTKDHLLVNRVIRFHWDRNHMVQVKGAYKHKYRRDLAQRIKGETSADVEKLLVALLG